MNIKDAIFIAFTVSGKKELHVNEISNYMQTSISDFKNEQIDELKKRVNSFLARNVKSATPQFSKVMNVKTKRPKKGVYSLAKKKPKKPIIRVDQQSNSTKKIEEKNVSDFNIKGRTNANNNYFGKAGEYAVVSELLFRNFDASIMSVDLGIDITASKNDKFYFIQVKSTNFVNGQISISIKPSKVINNSSANIYFIIVFRYVFENAYVNRYIVFQNADLERYVHTGLVSQSNGALHIKIKQQHDYLCLYNGPKSEDINYYLDNFDLIK